MSSAAETDERRVALVHDYLTQRGGAERVVLALIRGLGAGSVVTSLYDPRGCFPEFRSVRVETTWLQRIPLLPRHHRLGLPLYPLVFSRLRVDAPVTVCSTSGWAHGTRTSGRKVLYVHNTARWLYQPEEYLDQLASPVRRVVEAALRPLRAWDRRAVASADLIIANSRATAERIRCHWRRTAEVVVPPHSVRPSDSQQQVDGLKPGFYLAVARLLPYKRLDAVIAAVQQLPGRGLVVVGDGPDRHRLTALAGPETRFLPVVEDAQLRWLYANSAAVVVAAEEDLGLVPIEAMSFGRPVVARRSGGYLETVIEGETGIFFDRPDPQEIADAIAKAEMAHWNGARIRERADDFSEDAFAARIRSLLDPDQ